MIVSIILVGDIKVTELFKFDIDRRMTRKDRRLAWLNCVAALLAFGATACSPHLPEGPGHTTSADGTPIHYSVFGRGPTPLVFVHGWACDQTYWADQVTALKSEFTVVTIDLAGHGLSGSAREDWSIVSFANDVVAVLDALNLRQVVLIGHSLGGPVVLETAVTDPQRVAAVIGADTFHDFFANGDYEPVLEEMRNDFMAASEPFIRSMFVETSSPALVERILEDMLSQDPATGIAALEALQAWGPVRMERALSQVEVPLGAIQTTEFRAASSLVEASLGAASSTRIIELEGVGHFLMSEDPARFNAALKSLVAELTELSESPDGSSR